MKAREVFDGRLRNRAAKLALGMILGLGWTILPGPIAAQQQEERKVTEIFHVARAGVRGAAESREVLLAIYDKVAGQYNARIRREEQQNAQLYKGERVRVIKRLNDEDGHGPLFLVAYNGGPSVMAVKGDAKMSPGELSPPLKIAEAGKHTMEITRRVRVKDKTQREPALEVVDKKTSSGVPTFFGIPIDAGGGGGSSSSNSNSGGSSTSTSSGGGGGAKFKTVTKSNTLNKYAATVSTERMVEGPPKMSQELFMKLLKNGEVYEVSRAEKRRCQQCRGFGRVKTTKPIGFRDPDGRMVCPFCKGPGKVDWDVTYQVTW